MITVLTAATIVIVSVPAAQADWIEDGVAVCSETGPQTLTRVCSDGAGGMIMVWLDERGLYEDIYAQRIDAGGNVLWTTGGVAVCNANDTQNEPCITSDGAGGAIIAWADFRFGQFDIYAQRLNASGAAQWTANGIVICNDFNRQGGVQICSDGAGGAVIGWGDTRSGPIWQTYGQRVNASGSTLWTANGVQVTTSASNQSFLQVVPASGGAVFCWVDDRGVDEDIYAHRLDASGASQYMFDMAVCNATGNQRDMRAIPDGGGSLGAIIVWTDTRNGNYDIYAQRINMFGGGAWGGNGLAVCTATNNQLTPALTSDGLGGAFIAWSDNRLGVDADLYIQHLPGSGVPSWASDGVVACNVAGAQDIPEVVTDGAGGAIVVFGDYRNGQHNIFAQRVDGTGTVKWGTAGRPVCGADYFQNKHQVLADGSGGVLAAWEDVRNLTDYDIYAQRLEKNGYWGYPAPEIYSIHDIPGDQGGYVEIDWYASRLDPWPEQLISEYSIWRATTQAAAMMAASSGASLVVDPAEIPDHATAPLYRVEHRAAGTFFWQRVATVDAYYMTGYSLDVPTAHDSTSASPGPQYFQIIAHTSDPLVYWVSDPDSGYSLDNLAPAAPLTLAAQRAGSDVELEWHPSGEDEADFLHYAVYRAETSGFSPSPSYFLTTTPDTTLVDTDADPAQRFYYLVTSIDTHENESDPSNEAMADVVTGVDDRVPEVRAFTVLPNSPNPFGTTTEIRFGLPRAADVVLRVYDIAGRRVFEKRVEALPPGWRSIRFDGRDGDGRLLPSGVYLYRLTAAGEAQTRKMVITR
jgi:hypothetical protein